MIALFYGLSVAATAATQPPTAPPQPIEIGGATIRFVQTRQYTGPKPPVVRQATEQAAAAIVAYFGTFPVKSLEVRLLPHRESDGIFGQVPVGATTIELSIGSEIPDAKLLRDWTLVHEMVHLSFPKQHGRHPWFQEGLSTYVEPIARAMVKQVPVERLWLKLLQRTPEALGPNGEVALDSPRPPATTWSDFIGRTYWGGALFWLCVDLELRQKTPGKTGLRELLQGVLARGGNGSQQWSFEHLFKTSKEVTGTNVLEEQYLRFTQPKEPFDLKALWKKIGISESADKKLALDASAPLAWAREAILK